MTDLFGVEIKEELSKKTCVPRGYMARPGTGPEGETCKTCKFIARIKYSKTYLKCGLNHRKWTHGPGSDIRAGSPACQWWQPNVEDNPSVDVGLTTKGRRRFIGYPRP